MEEPRFLPLLSIIPKVSPKRKQNQESTSRSKKSKSRVREVRKESFIPEMIRNIIRMMKKKKKEKEKDIGIRMNKKEKKRENTRDSERGVKKKR